MARNFFFLIFFVFSFEVSSNANSNNVTYLIKERVKNMQKSADVMDMLKQNIKDLDYKKAYQNALYIQDWAMTMKEYFPVGSEAAISNSSAASNHIWEDFSTFEHYITAKHESAEKMVLAAKNKENKRLIKAFNATNKVCNMCHEKFRN